MDKREILEMIREHAEIKAIVDNVKSCFDAIVRRKKDYIVKIVGNLDSLAKPEVYSLSTVSSFFNSFPFIIAENSNNGPLEDYVLFKRSNVFAGTPRTFVAFIKGEGLPVKSHTYFYPIDGRKLAKLRAKKGLSLAKLSSVIGISKETLYRYEKNLILASKENIDALERYFGESLRKPFPSLQEAKVKPSKLNLLNAFEVGNPFTFLAYARKERFIIGKVKSKPTITLRYAAIYDQLSGVFNAEWFFISERAIPFPYLTPSEIESINALEELKAYIEKRKKASHSN